MWKYNHYEEKHRSIIVASKRLGVEVNGEKSKNIFMSCQLNVGDNCNIKIMW
jgi:hypothetical protein